MNSKIYLFLGVLNTRWSQSGHPRKQSGYWPFVHTLLSVVIASGVQRFISYRSNIETLAYFLLGGCEFYENPKA